MVVFRVLAVCVAIILAYGIFLGMRNNRLAGREVFIGVSAIAVFIEFAFYRNGMIERLLRRMLPGIANGNHSPKPPVNDDVPS